MNSMMEKIEEDRSFQSEMQLLRKTEIQMIINETEERFEQERRHRKE